MKKAKSFTAAAFLVILAGCFLLVFYSVARTFWEGVLPWYQPGEDGVTYLGLVEWFKDTCNTFCTTKLQGQVEIKEANAAVNRALGKWIFEDTDPEVIRMNNGHLTALANFPYEGSGVEEQLAGLRDYAESLGAEFLYVQAPFKVCALDPQLPMEGMSDANGEMTALMERLEALGVDTLDLRECLHADGLDHYGCFYRTDHHWTMETGLWAARTMAGELKERYGLGMDLEVLEAERYASRTWEDAFLGSWGRKVTLAYVPPEDFTLPVPAFDTSLHLSGLPGGVDRTGGFEILYDENAIVPEDYYTGSSYGAVMMGDTPYVKVVNQLHPDGPVVAILRESFAIAPSPYLSLAAGEIHLIDARYYHGSIRDLLAKIRPDAVLTLFNAQCSNMVEYLDNVW